MCLPRLCFEIIVIPCCKQATILACKAMSLPNGVLSIHLQASKVNGGCDACQAPTPPPFDQSGQLCQQLGQSVMTLNWRRQQQQQQPRRVQAGQG